MDFLIDRETSGKDRASGVGEILYAEYSDFTTIATLPAAPATQADKVTISSDHTFPVGNGFRKMYSLDVSTSIEVKGIGDEGSTGSEIVVNCFFPGTKKEMSAFFKDDPILILLVGHPDCGSNEYYQVGSKCRPARIMRDYGFQSGTSKDGVKGWTFKIRAYMSTLITYSGTVTTV